MSFSDDAVSFFGNTIGQMILILGGIIAGIKYLEKRQDKAMEEKAHKVLNPYLIKLCDDIQHLRAAIKNIRMIIDERSEHVFGELDRLDRQSGGNGSGRFASSGGRRRMRQYDNDSDEEEDRRNNND